MEQTFVLSDESLDRHSERVMVKGINLKYFKKNPIMLYNHNSGLGWFASDSTDQQLSIGIWKNLRVENSQLLAEAEFDEEDEFALKIKKKVEKGHINAVSIGFRGVAWSDDEKDKLPGQKGITFTKTELVEASIVTIPSNRNAVRKSFSDSIREGEEPKSDLIIRSMSIKSDTDEQSFKKSNMANNFWGKLSSFVKGNLEMEEALEAVKDQQGMSTEEIKALVKSEIKTMAEQVTGAVIPEFKKQLDEAIKDLPTKDEIDAYKSGLADDAAGLPKGTDVDGEEKGDFDLTSFVKSKIEEQIKAGK